jgi:hypothetical protein
LIPFPDIQSQAGDRGRIMDLEFTESHETRSWISNGLNGSGIAESHETGYGYPAVIMDMESQKVIKPGNGHSQ